MSVHVPQKTNLDEDGLKFARDRSQTTPAAMSEVTALEGPFDRYVPGKWSWGPPRRSIDR
jgi:hypothetical protein